MTRTIGWHYEQANQRIDALLRDLPADAWETAVPACPGWRVRDVVAHLLGNTEDGAAGRLPGIPSEELTAEQLARHRDDDPLYLLDQWALAVPFVADSVTASDRWPAAIDAVTHEHDLRSALGRPGARDHESIAVFAERLVVGLDCPEPLSVDLGDRTLGAGPDDPGPVEPITLATDAFELFRLRLGRRSERQVRALDWSRDPGPVLPCLFQFGPAADDLDE